MVPACGWWAGDGEAKGVSAVHHRVVCILTTAFDDALDARHWRVVMLSHRASGRSGRRDGCGRLMSNGLTSLPRQWSSGMESRSERSFSLSLFVFLLEAKYLLDEVFGTHDTQGVTKDTGIERLRALTWSRPGWNR